VLPGALRPGALPCPGAEEPPWLPAVVCRVAGAPVEPLVSEPGAPLLPVPLAEEPDLLLILMWVMMVVVVVVLLLSLLLLLLLLLPCSLLVGLEVLKINDGGRSSPAGVSHRRAQAPLSFRAFLAYK